MMLTKILILAALILVVGGVLIFIKSPKPIATESAPTSVPVVAKQKVLLDFGDQKIAVDNMGLRVWDGKSDQTGFTAKMANRVVSISGTKAAAIIVDNPGGSGTFYYLVGGTLKNDQELLSRPQLLGDRIKIDSFSVDNPLSHDIGLITVEYLNRGPKDPMSADPTVKVTKKYAFQDDGYLIEVLH